MTDPRNDRLSESDRDDAINYDAVTCGICDRLLTPATFAAWDAHDAFCNTCTVVSEAEFGVDTADDVPTDEEYHRPMTTGEALAMAVEAALVGNTLLNGADEECDVCNEPRGHEPTGLINRKDAVRIGGGALDDDELEDETAIDIEPLTTEYAIADLKSRGAA